MYNSNANFTELKLVLLFFYHVTFLKYNFMIGFHILVHKQIGMKVIFVVN